MYFLVHLCPSNSALYCLLFFIGILLPSLRTMLPLLDLHGVSRLEFHDAVQEALRERLLQQIDFLGKVHPYNVAAYP